MKQSIKKLFGGALLAAVLFAPLSVQANEIYAKGIFTGASDHVTTGNVSIIKTTNGGAIVVLDTNFSLDGAPDPYVGFGKDGKFVVTSGLGSLENNAGLQAYVVPPGIKVDNYNEVYIWCKKFSVPLGVAVLN